MRRMIAVSLSALLGVAPPVAYGRSGPAQSSSTCSTSHQPLAAALARQEAAGARLTALGRAILAAGGNLRDNDVRAALPTGNGFAKLVTHGRPDAALGTGNARASKAGSKRSLAGARRRAAGQDVAYYSCGYGVRANVTWWTGAGYTNPSWFLEFILGGGKTVTQSAKSCSVVEQPCYWYGYWQPGSNYRVFSVTIYTSGVAPQITDHWCY